MIQGVVLFTLALAVLMYVYVLELMFCLKIAVECVALVPEVEWAQATCYEHAIVAPSFAGKGTEVAVLGREAGEESWKNEALHTIQARATVATRQYCKVGIWYSLKLAENRRGLSTDATYLVVNLGTTTDVPYLPMILSTKF